MLTYIESYHFQIQDAKDVDIHYATLSEAITKKQVNHIVFISFYFS